MEKIKKTPSIRKKIFIYLLGFSSLLLLILWMFQVVFLEGFYKNIKVSQIKKSASAIEAILIKEKTSETCNNIEKSIGKDELAKFVEATGENNDICIEIIDINGNFVYGYDTGRNCIIHNMPMSEKLILFNNTLARDNELLLYVNDIKQSGSLYGYGVNGKSVVTGTANKSGIVTATTNKEGRITTMEVRPAMEVMPVNQFLHKTLPESIIYTKAVKNQNDQTYMILMNANINPVDATVSTLRIQLYWITGLMIILSGALALIITRRVSKPIESLNIGAKELAKGKYNTQFDGRGYKEIEELSDTLNIASVELSKVDTLRKELIANVTHDLRTPLTLITGYAEAMRDLPDELSTENAQVIVSEGKRLTSLVNDLLEISKLEQGTIPLEIKNYNLTSKIAEVVNSMGEMLKPEGYTLKFSYDQEVIVNSDEVRLTQAFYNLLNNAVNYSGQDKTVTVEQEIYTEGKEIWVKLKVYDTGIGIKEEDAPYIWERYYKVDKYHQRAVTGSGLGLSIVKNTMNQLEGKYGFEQQEIGSLFYIAVRVN